MSLLLTLVAFAALLAGLILLRVYWLRLSSKAQFVTILFACCIPALALLSKAIHWETSSSRLNCALYWGCIASYELFVLLFTLVRPVWLTSVIAFILIVPLLSASIFLPLVPLLGSPSATRAITQSIGNRLYADIVPWYSGTNPSVPEGMDLYLNYRPVWAPFLQHQRQKDRLYNTQCDTAKTSVTLLPDGENIRIDCPAWPSEPPLNSIHVVVHLE